ncbi:hypothetical protein AIOL_004758 [Candidatus Rhodobacter oscarellae]|uniref:Uncharacterized protein n=1 Tax=Candidatus Rhodobacter oscarellae TaxID=1675527 RepID=A0A0J9EAF5_9RHOB|nr:hypothetical protein [Candidatus Rhodobacter lobularis]KMW59775.1 hypothetical protein AIOL_004758 [Candidatus Rhodobacter lobularis]
MNDKRDQKRAEDARQAKEDRLKAALKANMAKRKAQARARAGEEKSKE